MLAPSPSSSSQVLSASWPFSLSLCSETLPSAQSPFRNPLKHEADHITSLLATLSQLPFPLRMRPAPLIDTSRALQNPSPSAASASAAGSRSTSHNLPWLRAFQPPQPAFPPSKEPRICDLDLGLELPLLLQSHAEIPGAPSPPHPPPHRGLA